MGRRPSPGSLASMSLNTLQAEIRRRQRSLPALLRRRDRAMAKVEKIDAQIRALGGEIGNAGRGGVGGGGGRKRAKNDASLVESLAKVLKGKTMSVTDVANAVQQAGYRTTAANFRTIVNQALIKFPKTFKKVARGQYTAA